MFRLAWKNLVNDRMRLGVALAGVAFAVFLMLIQAGIYVGFTRSASAVVDHCRADLWIVTSGSPNIEAAWPFSEDDLAAVKGTPGVASAEKLIHSFGYLRLPDGEGRWAQIFGFDPATGTGGPWEMVRGSVADLKRPGTYIVDESAAGQLQGLGVGDRLENIDRKMEIVGVCRGAKSYTTNPILFASYDTAQRASLLHHERAGFIVATLAPGADAADVAERLRRFPRFDVRTRREFAAMTRDYWASKTGVGVGIGLTVALGFVVGLVIVGQTMYASTVERLREFATLKALGATNAGVCVLLWTQAAIIAAAGWAAGGAGAMLAKGALADKPIAVHFDAPLLAAMLAATLAMCLGASLLSVVRVLRVDPAAVFK